MAQPPAAAVSASTSRFHQLSHMVDVVLRPELIKVLRRRDELYDEASRCVQLRRLLTETVRIAESDPVTGEPLPKGTGTSFGSGDTHREVNSSGAAVRGTEGSSRASVSSEAATTTCRPGGGGTTDASPSPMMLVDLGCHVYCRCVVRDDQPILIHVGLDVYVPMTRAEAMRFLVKKEGSRRAMADLCTKEALRVKFRIRLVLEALHRLSGGTASS